MNKVKLTQLMLGTLSCLALNTAVNAQEADPMVLTEPPAVERDFGSMDEQVAEEVRKLDLSGGVRASAANGNASLLLDSELKLAAKMEQLLEKIGVDAFAQQYPLLYKRYEKSPVILNQEKAMIELSAEILQAIKDAEAGKEEAEMGELRSDGANGFFDNIPMPKKAGEIAPTQVESETNTEVLEMLARIEDRMAELEVAAEEAPAAREQIAPAVIEPQLPISLRGIYGAGDKYKAKITLGTDVLMVRAGDSLPGNTKIEKVDGQSIVFSRDGDLHTLALGN